MPKVVDKARRREDLAEAVWRVVRRDGMEHASVRNVAKEARLSTGSLRHFFSSQSELLQFAMRTVIDRVEARVAALEPPPDPQAAAKAVLSELLPLDAERAAENEVWVAFSARAMVDEESRRLREDAYDRLRQAAHRWVEQLIPTAGAEVRKLESERLFALIDGLALHAAIHAEASPPELMRAVLDRHLDELSRTKIDQDDDAVSTFVHRWAEAIASNDVDAIEPFTTEDWVLIDGPGAIPRAKFHQVVADGTLRHDRMTHDVLDITPHGDVVVVRTRGRTSGSFQGAPIDADEWTTNVLVKESDGWRCALTQLTPVATEV